MNQFFRFSCIVLISTGAAITGCEQSSSTSSDGDSDTATASGSASSDAQETRAPDVRSMGSVTIGGTTLAISGTGAWRANGKLFLNIDKTNGPLPESLRLWVGQRSGEGSMKVRADAHDDHFHAEVEIPGTVTSTTMLWVEAEDADGQRDSRGIRLN